MSSKTTGRSIPTDPTAHECSTAQVLREVTASTSSSRGTQTAPGTDFQVTGTRCCALGYEVAAGTGGTAATVAGWPLEEADRLQQHRG